MSWVAAAIGGGAIVGGLISANASENAASTQADASLRAADASNATQRYMFDKSTELNEPWRSAGVDALDKIRTVLGIGGRKYTMDDLQQDPGYQFRFNEGQKGLERSAAARGGLISGRTGKELTRYGQEYAANEYGNIYNRLASVAGLGQASARDMGSAAMNAGANIGATTVAGVTGAANARASGYIGTANAITGAAGSGLSAWQSQQFINNIRPRYTMDNYQQVQPSVPGQFNLDTYG